jgi:cytochrome P450
MNEDVFPDASSFKPERWLVDGPVKVEMNRWFWVFGSGGRMCVGSHFAIYSEFCSSFDAVRIFQQEIIRQL